MRIANLSGKRFPHFIVLEQAQSNKWGAKFWRCLCDCGNTFTERSYLISSGKRQSCGCVLRATFQANITSHGMSRSAEYNIWNGARDRCRNPNNKDFEKYGGRGIRFWPGWDGFEAFIADVGPRPSPRHTLDRIDVDGNYEPGNCRWATPSQQANNKRCNIRVHVNGTDISLADYLGSSRGTRYSRINARLARGWSVADAIFQPRLKNREGRHASVA